MNNYIDSYELDPKDIKAFAEKPIGILLLIYSFSSVLNLLAMAAYEITDRIFVGRFGEADGLILMGAGLPFIYLLEAFCILLKVGGGTALSRILGKDDFDSAKELLSFWYLLSIAVGIAVSLAGLIFAEPIAVLCGAAGGQVGGAAAYIRVIALGSPFLFAMHTGSTALSCVGSPRQSVTVVVGACGLNIILDALFVIGFGWGLQGAAWATVIAQITGFLVGLIMFLRKNSKLRINLSLRRIRFGFLKEIATVGFANALLDFSSVMVSAITVNMLGRYGSDTALAQITVVNSCLALVYRPILGAGEGIQPIIAYNYGAKKYDRVKKTIFYALGVSTVFLIGIWFVIRLFSEQIVHIFSKDPVIMLESARALRISFIAAPFMVAMLIIPCVLSALGDVKYNMIINIAVQFVLQPVLLLVLPVYFGTDGIWIVTPLMDITVTIFSFVCCCVFFKQIGIINERIRKP